MPRLKPLELTLAGVDRITKPVQKAQRAITRLGRPIREIRSRLIALDRASGFKKLRGAAAGVGRQLGALGRQAAFFGVAIVAAAGSAINALVNTTDQIAKVADVAGIGVEALQEYRFAFDRAGVSQAATDKGLIKLGRSIGDLRAGTGTLITLLRKTDPVFMRQLTNAENSEEAFDLMLRKLAEMPNAMDRAALSAAAFGRTGQLMVNAVKNGIEEFEALRKRARELGLVLDEETVRKGEEAKDVFTDIAAVAKGLALSVGGDLLPEILKTSRALLDYVQANRELIRVELVSFVDSIVTGFKIFGEVLGFTIPLVRSIVDGIGGLSTVLAIAAAVITAKLTLAIYSLGAAIMTTPIGWFIAGLTGVVALSVLIYRNWDKITGVFKTAYGWITKVIKAAPAWIVGRLMREPGEAIGNRPAQVAAGGNVLGPRAAAGAAGAGGSGGAAGSMSGKLKIELSQERPPRVVESSTDPGFEIDIDSGMTLAPAGG